MYDDYVEIKILLYYYNELLEHRQRATDFTFKPWKIEVYESHGFGPWSSQTSVLKMDIFPSAFKRNRAWCNRMSKTNYPGLKCALF